MQTLWIAELQGQPGGCKFVTTQRVEYGCKCSNHKKQCRVVDQKSCVVKAVEADLVVSVLRDTTAAQFVTGWKFWETFYQKVWQRLASVMTNLIIAVFASLQKLRTLHILMRTVFSSSSHKSFFQGDSASLCRMCRTDTSKYTPS